MTESQVSSVLKQIDLQTLLIFGSKGMLDSATIERRCNNLNNAPIRHYIEGGHHIHMEAPKKVADIIRTFLQ